MTTIAEVAEAMQTVLTTVADEAARDSGFVERESKLTGAKFAQTLVFGWLSNSQATLEELSQTAATLGVGITPQGLDQRFSSAAAQCMKQILDVAIETLVSADAVAIPILQRFDGVYLLDSSTITLPDALEEIWPGCGGRVSRNTKAALKLQVYLDLQRGTLQGPVLESARKQDRSSSLQRTPLPKGSLRLADLGYFSLDLFDDLNVQGVYWLSRLQIQTGILDPSGQRLDLVKYLEDQVSAEIDLPILLGVRHRIPCRLLITRVPQEVADQRRRRLREQARSRGQTVSKKRLKLADWIILITNVPEKLLSLAEASVLYRSRWQIELLFKLWKSHGRIDESRSVKPWRILCEVYGKLVAMLVQHWLFLTSCWQYPDRSLTKAAKTVQRHALHLASVFGHTDRLSEALSVIRRCLRTGCRMNTRRRAPNTYQLLLNPPKASLT